MKKNPLSDLKWLSKQNSIKVEDMSTIKLYNTIKLVNKSYDEMCHGVSKTAWLLSLKTELNTRLNSRSNRIINTFPTLKKTINTELYAKR